MMQGPKPVQYDGTPLMITNVGDEPIEVSLNFNALRKTEPPIIYYNTTGKKSYKKWDLSNITLAKGGTLYLFGENSVVDSTFVVNGNSSIHVDGKLEALLQGQVGTAQFGNYALEGLFKDVTQLESVGDIMPQVIGGVNAPSGYSTGYRYSSLFENTGIVEIPDNFLKETTISNPHSRLYNRMFFGCTKLTTIPRDLFINQNGGSGSIGATYYSMFQDCSNLEVAADLYIQTQGFQSAYSMYRGCKKITDVKVFTKTLANNHCMQYFVADCDNLQSIDFDIDRVTHWGVLSNAMLNCKNLTKVSIKVKTWNHEQTTTTHVAYSNWMKGVSPTGTFICPKELAEATDGYYDEEGNFVKGVGRGVDTVPAGWYIDYPIIDARDGDTNAMALMAVIYQQTHADGTRWVKDSLVMMKSEAEKVEDIGTAFQGNKSITSFDQLQYFGITSIKTQAFEGCSVLRSITLPDIQSIESRAFSGCVQLGNVTLPESLLSIASHAFRYCYYFTDIFIPGGLNSISANAFTSIDVNSIVVSQDNTTYDSRNNCNAIIQTNTNELVVGCKNTTILNDIASIGNSAFYSYGVPSNIVIHSNIKSIGNSAFMQTRNAISTITFEEGLTSLGASAFMYQNSIQEILLPNSLITIGSNCFGNMQNIKKIRIGNAVKSIHNAFAGCSALKTLICEAEVPIDLTYIASNGQIINAIPNNTCILYVPDNSVEAYSQQDYWGRFSQIKPLSEYTE